MQYQAKSTTEEMIVVEATTARTHYACSAVPILCASRDSYGLVHTEAQLKVTIPPANYFFCDLRPHTHADVSSLHKVLKNKHSVACELQRCLESILRKVHWA